MTTLLALAAAFLIAQSSAQPAFQTATIKLNLDHPPRRMARPLPAGFSAENASLKMLIINAYQLQPFQIVSGPSWMESDGYDVTAKSETPIDRATAMKMLQALLAERFALKVRLETREQPVYELTIAKGGPKLPAPKEGSCLAPSADGAPPPLPPQGQRFVPRCGLPLIGFNGTLSGGKMTTADLAKGLAAIMGRPVIDRTGFTGEFDVELKFSAESAGGMALPPGMGPPPGSPGGPPAPLSDPDRPSIFAAVQEQLGLKLSSAKGPVEVLVIDHVERPSAN